MNDFCKTSFVVVCLDCGRVEMKQMGIHTKIYKNTKFSCVKCGNKNTQFVRYGWVKKEVI